MNEDIVIGAGGIAAPDENEPKQTQGDIHNHITFDGVPMGSTQMLEDAIMEALRRMEKRKEREFKKMQDKAKRAHRRRVRESRRKNRG